MLRRLEADQTRFYVMFPRTRDPDFGGEGDDVSEMMRNLASAVEFVRGIIAMSDDALERHHAGARARLTDT